MKEDTNKFVCKCGSAYQRNSSLFNHIRLKHDNQKEFFRSQMKMGRPVGKKNCSKIENRSSKLKSYKSVLCKCGAKLSNQGAFINHLKKIHASDEKFCNPKKKQGRKPKQNIIISAINESKQDDCQPSKKDIEQEQFYVYRTLKDEFQILQQQNNLQIKDENNLQIKVENNFQVKIETNFEIKKDTDSQQNIQEEIKLNQPSQIIKQEEASVINNLQFEKETLYKQINQEQTTQLSQSINPNQNYFENISYSQVPLNTQQYNFAQQHYTNIQIEQAIQQYFLFNHNQSSMTTNQLNYQQDYQYLNQQMNQLQLQKDLNSYQVFQVQNNFQNRIHNPNQHYFYQ